MPPAGRLNSKLRRPLRFEALETRAVPATYFVATTGDDHADGTTLGAPLKTIQHALDLARSPGDIVEVRAGVYHEQVSFKASGTRAGGAIVLKNHAQELPILDGAGLPGGNMISIVNRSFVQVLGFEIRNNLGVRDGSGIRVQGRGSNIVLRGNHIHDMRGKNAMGITVYGTSTAGAISHLVIDRNDIFDCEPSPSEALTLNGNVAGFSVTKNLVRDVNNIGIDVIGGETDINPDPKLVARNGVVRGNLVTNAHSNYGGGYAGGIYVDGGRTVTVENNVSYQNDMGIEIGAENAGTDTSGIIVRNNVVYHNDKAGIAVGGYAANVGRVKNSFIVNNAVVENDQDDNPRAVQAELWIQYASDNVITNNIFVAGEHHALISTTRGDVNNLVDFNLWYSPGGARDVQIVWHGRDFATFGGYRSASDDDSHSRFALPRFAGASTANYQLTANSPAIDAGTLHDGWFAPTDFNGVKRPQGKRPDAGAFEDVA